MLRRIWLPGLIVVLTLMILIQSQRMQDEAMTSALVLTPVASPIPATPHPAFAASPIPVSIFTQPPLPIIVSATPLMPSLTPIPSSTPIIATLTPIIPTATPVVPTIAIPTTTPSPASIEVSATPETLVSAAVLPTATFFLTPTLPASAVFAVQITHTVQTGDTLYRIATAYGITVELLADANRIADPSQIFVGQQLVIPAAGQPIATTTLIPARASGRDVTVALAANEDVPLPAVIPVNVSVNNLTLADFLIMPPNVIDNIRAVYEYGKILNRNPRAFSKLGDSTIENPHFLTRFDESAYNLGGYAYLQPVIDYYHGSFGRQSRAVIRGLHTWSVLDPMWAGGCLPAENMLACEFRLHNPALIFVRLGSNDKGVPESTERHLREIINYCLGNGIIPIMGTKADRFDGAENINNQIIRRLAAELKVPLWDFDLLAGTIPGRGLGPDNVHMTTFFAHDWTLPEAYTTGNGVHSITALMVLDAVWRILNE